MNLIIRHLKLFCPKERGILSWRNKFDLLLHRLNIIVPSELLDKDFGLYSDTRIDKLCILFNRQINKLREMIVEG